MTCRRSVGILFGILLLAAACYLPAMHGEFQFDDEPAIVLNSRAKSLSAALDGFFARYASGRPLSDVSFALDHAWSGIDPWGYHLTNLLLHLAASVLVFGLARLLLRRAGVESQAAPILTAALFALHPLQSQAVIYLAQRSEVLSSLLYLTALLALLAAEERWGGARGWALYGFAAAVFLLALGAKPIAVTLPVAFLLVRYALPGRTTSSRREAARPILLSIPFFLGSAAIAWASLRSVGGRDDAGFDIPGLGPGRYLLTQGRVILRYLRLLAWPAGQNLDYDLAPSRALLDPPSTLVALLLLALLVAAAALAWHRAGPHPDTPVRRAARLSALGLLWYLLLLAPSSSILPLADLIEEHRCYLANFGPFLAAGGALGCLAQARPRSWARAALATSALACLLLAGALRSRAQVWSSRLTLWTDVTRKSPEKQRAHMNRGHALEKADRLEEAVAEYRRTLALSPDPWERSSSQTAPRQDVLRNLGSTYLSLHRLAEAAATLEEAIALAPASTDLQSTLAMVYLDQGKLGEAERWAGRALQLDPDDGRAENTLGEIRMARGEVAGALQAFRRGAELDPDNAVRMFNTGMAADKLGRTAEACAAYERYLQLQAHTGQPDLDVQARVRELRCEPSGRERGTAGPR